MSNLRIVSDNALQRTNALAASSTAGLLVAGSLKTDIKGDIWRSTSTSATLTVGWSTGERIGCVALPHTNLSQAATIRVRLYSDAGATLISDTGPILACPATPVKIRGWGASAAGVMAYAYGGGSAARVWFEPVSGVKQVVIDISDPGNAAGYVEASQLVVGDYWSPQYTADVGVSLAPRDLSTVDRRDSGDQSSKVGTRHREMSITLSNMHGADRSVLLSILRSNGVTCPIFFSLFPESSDHDLERDYEMYCTLSEISAMTIQFYDNYSAPLTLVEV